MIIYNLNHVTDVVGKIKTPSVFRFAFKNIAREKEL